MFRESNPSWSTRSSTSCYTGPIEHIPEEWRSLDFLGYPDYDVSDLGRVRSLKHGKVRVLRPGTSSPAKGMDYLQVCLYRNGRKATRVIHILVARAFVLNPDPLVRTQVAHADGDERNNRATNLRWDTPKGNREDRRMTGTASTSPKRGSRLTFAEAKAIKQLLASGMTSPAIAARFGCTAQNIREIARGYSWRHA